MLVNTDPPQESVRILGREMTAAAADGRLAYYLDQPVRVDTLSASAPHPFFVMNASTVMAEGVVPTAAQYSGWRYVLEVNHRAVALATTVTDADDNHRYGGIGTGPAVSAVVFAVHVADELLRNRREDFTMAAVDIPDLHTVLLQVVNPDWSVIAFLPIGLTAPLHPAHLYTPEDIRDELRRITSRREPEPPGSEPVGG